MQPNNKLKNFVLFTFLCLEFLGIIAGARGSFITYLLFLMWYFNSFGRKKINIAFLSLYMLAIVYFLSFIFSLITIREVGNSNSSFIETLAKFFYEQGITMMVFAESLKIENYPILPYFQNFIPGTSFIYSFLNGELYSYENNFGYYLGYTLNPKMHEMGYGLGWSFYADMYRYSFGNILFYCLIISIFSIFLNNLILKANIKKYSRFILIVSATSLLFLPREVLSTFFPLIIYASLIYYLIVFWNKR